MLMKALAVPIAVGLKVTAMEQLEPAASFAQLSVSREDAGLAPPMPMLVMVIEAVPVFLTVTVCGADAASTVVPAKVSDDG